MIVAAIPLRMSWADRDENLKVVKNYLEALRPDTDIVVLPELFSSGFIQDVDVIRSMAEPTTGYTIDTLKSYAAEYNVAIAGSFLCAVSSKILNRGFFIEPSGEETFYDKRHLFSLSAEHEIFTAGEELPKVVRFRGWNVSLVVCYDLRFPAWCRNRNRGKFYDIMLVPANWPDSRAFAWDNLLSARAIENQAIYVGGNRGGQDDFGVYSHTDIYDPLGQKISDVDSASGIVYATYKREDLIATRSRLPFGNDADDFSILACSK